MTGLGYSSKARSRIMAEILGIRTAPALAEWYHIATYIRRLVPWACLCQGPVCRTTYWFPTIRFRETAHERFSCPPVPLAANRLATAGGAARAASDASRPDAGWA